MMQAPDVRNLFNRKKMIKNKLHENFITTDEHILYDANIVNLSEFNVHVSQHIQRFTAQFTI